MPGRLGPRFAIEALFLIALAVGAAYADLERKWIALVMAVGWLVVALLELAADRIWAAAPPWRRPNYMAAPSPSAEARVGAPAPPAAPPQPKPEPVAGEGDRGEPPLAGDPPPPVLEPLEPGPKRRWFRRKREEPEVPTPAPEPPKHVRLLPPSEQTGRTAGEVTEIFDTTEQEEHSRR